jgi:hypothetical protein
VTEPIVSWPPTHEQQGHLARLATLIRQFGAERFTEAPLVRADERDFPETWEPTPTGVHRVLYRLCWHAHWEPPNVVVADVRPPKAPNAPMLVTSEIELASATVDAIRFEIGAIGNDDVAGLLSHRLGLAFLELAPGDPFRGDTNDLTETAGSVAAVYLGLGVLVANSSMYRRYASRTVARAVIEEQHVAKVGGLSIADATFLVAVQDIVRDDFQPALETLHEPQREWIERWKAVLDPHEDELRAMLELDAAEPHPLERGAVPRTPPALPERDLRKFNVGRTTFRVPYRGYWAAGLGVAAGIFGFLAPVGLVVGPAAMLGLGVAGLFAVKPKFMCSDPECMCIMETAVETCPRCGGSIADTIKSARDRLDALDELREAGRAHPEDHP